MTDDFIGMLVWAVMVGVPIAIGCGIIIFSTDKQLLDEDDWT